MNQDNGDSNNLAKQHHPEVNGRMPKFLVTRRYGYSSDVLNPIVASRFSNDLPLTDKKQDASSYGSDAPHPFIKAIHSFQTRFINQKKDTIKSRQAGESFRTRRRQCRAVRRQRCRRPSNLATSRIFLTEEQITYDKPTLQSQGAYDTLLDTRARNSKGNIF